MRSLSLALRGIWWRRWASLPILVVAVACAAVAATGPAYATNAREAVLTASLRSAPTDARGTGITTTLALDSTVTTRSFRRQADDAFLDLVAAGFAHAPITSVEDGQSAFRPTGPPVPIADLSLVDRPDACRHVTLRAGRCLRESDPFGVLITTQTAAARGWQVGTRVRVGGVDTFKQDVRVAGIYTPDAPSGRYWLDATHHYFGQVAGFATSKVPRTDAVLVPAAFFGEHPPSTGDNAVSISDVTIRVDRIDLGSLARFEAMAASAVTEVQTPLGTVQTSPELVTDLRPTITAARDATDFVTFPILVIAIQLTILTWLVLYLVLVGSAEGRTSEVVLGKLRGLTPRQTVLHALLEPLLLIVVAVPVGVVVSDALLRAAAPTLFGDSVRFAFPPAAWLAAIGAGLGGVIASVLAGVALLRRSVVEQWRRAERRPRRAGRALDAVVVALAVAGFLDLAAAPSAEAAADRNLQFVASAAPSLLAIAGALLAVRIMPLAAGTVLGRSRGSRHVARFVAVRQIRRRPGELRVFLLLTVAVGLLVFGVASTTVFTANRDARARVTIGADRVLRVAAPRTVDLAAEVARLDPSGRRAAAVYQGPLTANLPSGTLLDTTATATPSVLIADPARFAAVAFWRADFGSRARLADQLRPLTERPPQPVRIASPSLRVTMQAMVAATGPMAVAFGLTDSDGVPFSVRVADLPTSSGPSPARAQTTTVAVPRCTTGCLLRRLAVYPRTDDGILLQARLAVSRVDEIGPRGTTAVLPRLLASRWAALDSDAEGKPVEQIDASGAVLTVLMRPSSAPTNDGEGYGIVSALPARVPGLATASQVPPPGANRAVSLSIDGASDVPIVPTVVGVLPRAGDAGALIPRSWLAAARPFGFATLRPNQVWLSAQAPDDFARRLERAGVAVLDIQTASAQAGVLDDQGPSFAVRMLEFGAVASAALAVAGVATSLIVASRRRLYEIAALRSLGVGTRHVLASVVIEQGVIATVATLVGLAAGLAGARVALDKLPEFADSPAYPRLVVDLPVLVCVGLAVAVVAIVSLVVAIGAAALVRQASPSRLREAQQ